MYRRIDLPGTAPNVILYYFMLWTVFYLYRVTVWSTLLFRSSALRLAQFCVYIRVSVLPRSTVSVCWRWRTVRS